MFFLKTAMHLPEEQLNAVVAKALGRELESSRKERMVSGNLTSFHRMDDDTFVVNTFSRIYVDDVEQALVNTRDVRARRAIQKHRAWWSIGSIHREGPHATKTKLYKHMLRVAAEVLNDDCLAIYIPELGKLVPVDESTKSTLSSEDAFERLND